MLGCGPLPRIGAAPLPRIGEENFWLSGSFLSRTIRLYSSTTILEENQMGPICWGIKMTGVPFFLPDLGTYANAAHVLPVSAPFKTPFT